MVIRTTLNCAFIIIPPCATCGKTGHSFNNCEELRDQATIWKSYIQLRVALHRLKGIAASQGRNVNSL